MTIKRRALFCIFCFLVCKTSFSQCNGNNTFLGTINKNWHLSSNWSSNCVPTIPISGEIIIAADCDLQDTMAYHFLSNSNLVVNTGIIFNIIVGLPSVSTWTCGDTIQYGGKVYGTILLGDQCWMSNNLDIGSMISSANSQTNNNVIEKYCMDDLTANCNVYGGLYQWNEIMSYTSQEGAKGICPSGWHIPSELEWQTLESAISGMDKGSQLSGNSNLWEIGLLTQSTLFQNTSFQILPGGLSEDGSTLSEGANAFFWSSTSFPNQIAAGVNVYFDYTELLPAYSVKANGYSVRCVKD